MDLAGACTSRSAQRADTGRLRLVQGTLPFYRPPTAKRQALSVSGNLGRQCGGEEYRGQELL